MTPSARNKDTDDANRVDKVAAADNQAGDRLDSWKAIAAYLGRDTGTVRRWERTRGLPVHRVPGGKGSSVFAFTDEIDAWLRSAPRESPDTNGGTGAFAASHGVAWLRWTAVAMAVAGVVLLAWRVLASRPVEPVRLDVDEHRVIARGGDGQQLWEYSLQEGHRHVRSEVAENSRIVAGDSPAVYFTTSNRYRIPDNFASSGELTSLDAGGRLRWTFRFTDALTVGGKPYGEPWAVTAFAVESAVPSRRVAVAAHHWLWSPSLVAILDDSGKRLGTYMNVGWIEQIAWLTPERLAIGGFYEELNGGLVGLLDPSHLDGQSPASPESPHFCRTCGPGKPLRLAVMPRSEVNLASQSRFNRAILELTGDGLIVRTVEVPADNLVNSTRQGAADALYEFTSDLELVRASYSQRYWDVHAELETAKKLDHTRADCPDRDGPRALHTWTPNSGWRATSIR
jgi:hypothetical protein